MNNSNVLSRSPQVFIVVLNWNNAPDTIECLESIFRLNNDNFQVVVCDNASTDNSLELILNWLTKHRRTVNEVSETGLAQIKSKLNADTVVIKNKENYGYAGGNNRGLGYVLSVGSENDFVWIVNNDTTFHPEALNALKKDAVQRPEVNFFGSTILSYDKRDLIQTQGGDRFYPWFAMSHHIGEGRKLEDQLPQATVEEMMTYIVGASVFARFSAVEKLGFMEERYFLYFEEIDWATRARRLGMRLGYVPASLVYHKEGATIGSSTFAHRKSLLSDYYGVKNRIVMTRRLFPWALPTVYLAMLITLLKRLFTGQFDRVWMVIAIIFGFAKPPTRPS